MSALDDPSIFGIMPGEAQPERPVTKDWSGQLWDQRPDVVVEKYVRNVPVIDDEEFVWFQGRLAVRDWPALQVFLMKKKELAEDDDVLRLNRALEVIRKVTQPGG